MRGLLILCAFVTLTTAAPQQGYQYAVQPVGGQQSHAQYGGAPSQVTDFMKDLQTVMAVQSGNLAPNFAINTQHQVVANVGSAASARVSVGQPQARYLAPIPAEVNAFRQQQQQVPQQQVPQQQVSQQHILQQQVPQRQISQQQFPQHQIPQQQYQFQQPQALQQQSQPQPIQQLEQHQISQQQQAFSLQHIPEPQQAQHLQQQPHAAESETIVSKRFYLHAAPEDDEDEVKQHHVTVGKPRKNYNVVFIKSSDKSNPKTSLKITPAVNEEKTVIYVLNKKHDATDIDTQVFEPVTSTAKPEVYFIKYKTAEEAAHAQQTIQAQYDALGGSTQINNEGVAAESSVIGALDAAATTKHAEAAAAADDAAGASEATQSSLAVQLDEQQQQQPAQIPVVPAAEQSAASGQPEEQLQSVEQSLVQSGVNTNNGYLPPARYYYR